MILSCGLNSRRNISLNSNQSIFKLWIAKVARERIDEIEGTHDEDLFPPPRAVLTDLFWHRGMGVIRHDVSTLGRQG